MTQDSAVKPVQTPSGRTIPADAWAAYNQLCMEYEPSDMMSMNGSIFPQMNSAGGGFASGGFGQLGAMGGFATGMGNYGSLAPRNPLEMAETIENLDNLRELIMNKRNTVFASAYKDMVAEIKDRYQISEKQARTILNQRYQMYTGNSIRNDLRKHTDNWFEWTTQDELVELTTGLNPAIIPPFATKAGSAVATVAAIPILSKVGKFLISLITRGKVKPTP